MSEQDLGHSELGIHLLSLRLLASTTNHGSVLTKTILVFENPLQNTED
jgi:hypothetical protein